MLARHILGLIAVVSTFACGSKGEKPKTLAECQASSRCKAFGACGVVNGQCGPTSDEMCHASESCPKHGECTLVADANRCGPGRMQDCTESSACARPEPGKPALCTYDPRDHTCLVVGALVCSLTSECTDEGKCTKESYAPDPSQPHDTVFRCAAKSDQDCASSTGCTRGGKCVARDGECQLASAPAGEKPGLEGLDQASAARRLAPEGWSVETLSDYYHRGAKHFSLSIKSTSPGDSYTGTVSYWDFTLSGKAADVGPTRAIFVETFADAGGEALLRELAPCVDHATCKQAFKAARMKDVDETTPSDFTGYLSSSFSGSRDDDDYSLDVLDYAPLLQESSHHAVKVAPPYVLIVETTLQKRDAATSVLNALSH